MRTNYHTHTQRCGHAFGREEDYVRAALDARVTVLGFSDHAPFPDQDYGCRMPYEELEPYLAAVGRLSHKPPAGLQIRKGLEIEYLPQYRDYYLWLTDENRTDYLLMGEHFYQNRHGGLHNITQAEDTAQYVDYARAIAEGLGTGFFQVIAHPDLFAINSLPWDENCEEAIKIILSAAAEAGAVLEFNANGLRRGIQDYPDGPRYMYPHRRFWQAAAGTGISVIVGSDCHQPGQMWDSYMDQSYAILKELGIEPILILPERPSRKK